MADPRETIFDHQVTQNEMAEILPIPFTREKWLRLGKSQNTEWGHIVHLYQLRRDEAKVKEYLDKITDPEYAHSLVYNDTLP